MNKETRLYPWYVYNGTEVVLIDNDKAKEYALDYCDGGGYAVPISTAEQLGWELSIDTCNPTFLLSYESGDYRLYDSGEDIEIQTILNPENEEHEINVWEVKK